MANGPIHDTDMIWPHLVPNSSAARFRHVAIAGVFVTGVALLCSASIIMAEPDAMESPLHAKRQFQLSGFFASHIKEVSSYEIRAKHTY